MLSCECQSAGCGRETEIVDSREIQPSPIAFPETFFEFAMM